MPSLKWISMRKSSYKNLELRMDLHWPIILFILSSSYAIARRKIAKIDDGDNEERHTAMLNDELRKERAYTPHYREILEPLRKTHKQLKKIRQNNIKRKKGGGTTPYVYYVYTDPIDEKYFYKDPILNIYNNEGRRKLLFEISGAVDSTPSSLKISYNMETSQQDTDSSKSLSSEDVRGERCYNHPISVCVESDECSMENLSPDGNLLCKSSITRLVCCKTENQQRDIIILANKKGKTCNKEPPGICMLAKDCKKKYQQPQGQHICENEVKDMVCCAKDKRGLKPAKKSKWGVECLKEPLSICVLLSECSEKYETPKGNKVCKGSELMICCNFYNVEYLSNVLMSGRKPEKKPSTKKTTVAVVTTGAWGSHCNHKPISICVLPKQCTSKYHQANGNRLCTAGSKKMVCCDIYNYSWEMLFGHGNIDSKDEKALKSSSPTEVQDNLGAKCDRSPGAICVAKSECTEKYRLPSGDYLCSKMVCCLLYKQLWNLLIDNKLPDSESEETTTIQSTTSVARKSQWGVRCKSKHHICVLPQQCAKRYQTSKGHKTCNKGIEKMVCCDYITYIWDTFKKYGNLLDKKNDTDSKTIEYKNNFIVPKKPNRLNLHNSKIKISNINLNGSYVQIHQVKVKKPLHIINPRRHISHRSIYLPNGEPLWRVRAKRGNTEDNDIADVAQHTIQNAINKLLYVSNNSDEIDFEEHIRKFGSYLEPQKHQSDSSSSSDVHYDNQGIYSEDVSASDLSLGLDEEYGDWDKNWGKSCSQRPQSLCVKKKQCKDRHLSPEGERYCRYRSKGLVCCNVRSIWEMLFNDEDSSSISKPHKQLVMSKIWGKTCSHKPESVCVLERQCTRRYKSPQGHHFCSPAGLICCDIYYLWKSAMGNYEYGAGTTKKNILEYSKINVTTVKCSHNPPSYCVSSNGCEKNNLQPQGHHFCQNKNHYFVCCKQSVLSTPQVDNSILSQNAIKCSNSPPSICVLPNNCDNKYWQPQGHHFCSKTEPIMICCSQDVVTKETASIPDTSLTTINDHWGKLCSRRPESICVYQTECIPSFQQHHGTHLCNNRNRKLICCDYIRLLWTILIENGKLPYKNYSEAKDNWGMLCSDRPKSVCVLPNQCATEYHSPQGHHFCITRKQSLVCCDFISHLYDVLIVKGDSDKTFRNNFNDYSLKSKLLEVIQTFVFSNLTIEKSIEEIGHRDERRQANALSLFHLIQYIINQNYDNDPQIIESESLE